MPERASSPVEDAARWLAWVRLGAVPFAVFQVATSERYPAHYEAAAWITTAIFGIGALVFFALTRFRPRLPLALASVAFDTAVISTYILIYSYEQSTPVRQLIFLPIAEGALLYGIRGSITLAVATAPVIAVFEELRSRRTLPHSYQVNFVTFEIGVGLIMGLIIGWLVLRLRRERLVAETRASEAEGLRDELGRRVDLLEAANHCARALGSSLDIEHAFSAFLRELTGLVPFERVTTR